MTTLPDTTEHKRKFGRIQKFLCKPSSAAQVYANFSNFSKLPLVFASVMLARHPFSIYQLGPNGVDLTISFVLIRP